MKKNINKYLKIIIMPVIALMIIKASSIDADPVFKINYVEVWGAIAFFFPIYFLIILTEELRKNKKIYLLFNTGLFLLFAGALEDIVDEFYVLTSSWSLLENISIPVGFLFLTMGVYFWMKERAKLVADLELAGVTDFLTSLYNIKTFYKDINIEQERAHRYFTPFSLLMIDIDNFKNFNDTYGHPEGDKVIKYAADAIRSSLRVNDRAYRYGGEEYCVLLPETDRDSAILVAERIRKLIKSTPLLPRDESPVYITVSIGIATFSKGEVTAHFVKRADDALYKAKKAGKDCCKKAR